MGNVSRCKRYTVWIVSLMSPKARVKGDQNSDHLRLVSTLPGLPVYHTVIKIACHVPRIRSRCVNKPGVPSSGPTGIPIRRRTPCPYQQSAHFPFRNWPDRRLRLLCYDAFCLSDAKRHYLGSYQHGLRPGLGWDTSRSSEVCRHRYHGEYPPWGTYELMED